MQEQAYLTARLGLPPIPMPRLHAPSKEDSRLLPPFSALPERCIHVPATDAEFAAARAALMAAPRWDHATLDDLAVVMADASICGLGQAAPNAIRCVQTYFPEDV